MSAVCCGCGRKVSPRETVLLFENKSETICAKCIAFLANEYIGIGKISIITQEVYNECKDDYFRINTFAEWPAGPEDLPKVSFVRGSEVGWVKPRIKTISMDSQIKEQTGDLGEIEKRRNKALFDIMVYENFLMFKNMTWSATNSRLYGCDGCRGKMPPVPKPFILFTGQVLECLPEKPGVYFIWESGEIIYVGQSANVRSRLTSGHHVVKAGQMISYIECDRHDLLAYEAYYLWLCRPTKNAKGGFSRGFTVEDGESEEEIVESCKSESEKYLDFSKPLISAIQNYNKLNETQASL
jgi:hypothetical protein